MATELGCDYEDVRFGPEPEPVLVPDPSQEEKSASKMPGSLLTRPAYSFKTAQAEDQSQEATILRRRVNWETGARTFMMIHGVPSLENAENCYRRNLGKTLSSEPA